MCYKQMGLLLRIPSSMNHPKLKTLRKVRKRALIERMEQEFFCCLMTCVHRRSFDRLKNWNLASARVTVLKEGESRRSDASWYSWVGSLTS